MKTVCALVVALTLLLVGLSASSIIAQNKPATQFCTELTFFRFQNTPVVLEYRKPNVCVTVDADFWEKLSSGFVPQKQDSEERVLEVKKWIVAFGKKFVSPIHYEFEEYLAYGGKLQVIVIKEHE